MMRTALTVLAAGLIAVLVFEWVVLRRPASMMKRLGQFAAQVDLAVKPGTEGRVARRLTARFLGGATASVALLVVGVLVIWVWPEGSSWAESVDPMVLLVVLLASSWIGQPLGVAAVGVTEALRAPATGARLARSHTPRLLDFVPRAYVAAAVVLPAGAIVLWAVGAATGWPARAGIPFGSDYWSVLALVALLGFAVAAVGTVLVLRRPQPAADTWELMWQDVLRSLTLRDAASGAITMGAYSTFLIAAGVARGWGWGLPGWAMGVLGLVAAATVAVIGWCGVATLRRPSRYALRTLWPRRAPAPAPASTQVPSPVLAPAPTLTSALTPARSSVPTLTAAPAPAPAPDSAPAPAPALTVAPTTVPVGTRTAAASSSPGPASPTAGSVDPHPSVEPESRG